MLNHIVIMGRLTREPELRKTQDQVSVTSFTLAVDRDRANSAGERLTDFIDCSAWRSTAEFVSKYFHRGSMAVVSGRLQSRKWQDKEGNNCVNWEIVADNVYFGEGKREAGETGGDYSARYEPPKSAPRAEASHGPFEDLGSDDEELPF